MQHSNDNFAPLDGPPPRNVENAEIAAYAISIPLAGLNRIWETIINGQQGASYIWQATTLAETKEPISEAIMRFKLAYLYERSKE